MGPLWNYKDRRTMLGIALLRLRTPQVFLWKKKTLLVDRPDAPKDSESVAFLQTRRAIDLSRSFTCKIRTTLGEEMTLNFTIDFLATSCDETEHLPDVILETLFVLNAQNFEFLFGLNVSGRMTNLPSAS